ncbi:MAG: DUF2460 domain-containing protein [Lentilitoribacter sp.]
MSSSFHEVSFPMSLALGTTGGPERQNDIVLLSNGYESRNARWRSSRRRFDAGSGMKSAQDLYLLIAFFEARCGNLYGFRFKDPIDHLSCGYGQTISATDQQLGIGDGANTDFQLTKTYADIGGSSARNIQKPVSGSVRIAINGVELFEPDFEVDIMSGEITFATPPSQDTVLTSGFEFDVPVRFDLERLDINVSNFHAGHIPSIPLIEIKLENDA